MPTFLSPEQCIALLPKTFTSIIPIKRSKHKYDSNIGKLYIKGSKDYKLPNKKWYYSIKPEVIKNENFSYIILAADFKGIFVIPVEIFFAYRKRHSVGSRNAGEDFTILYENNKYIRRESRCKDEDLTQYFYPTYIISNTKHQPKILFANIGWMISYNGQSHFDKISGGGAYSDKDKHESINFQNLNGKCYGYIQPAGEYIGLQRVNLDILPNDEYVENVTVVWFATNPIVGGSWIVGWYKNATVYRKCQKSNDSQRNYYVYNVVASFKDCTLLPIDERLKQIPRQVKKYPGRSNIWYADAPEVAVFKNDVLDYILHICQSKRNILKKTVCLIILQK